MRLTSKLYHSDIGDRARRPLYTKQAAILVTVRHARVCRRRRYKLLIENDD